MRIIGVTIYLYKNRQSINNIIPTVIHPEFVHHPHLGIPGFMAVFTHLTCVGSNWMTYDSRFTMDAETLLPSDLQGIASAAGSTKKDLEAPDNKLESTCHKPGSTSILQHVFSLHGSWVIMYMHCWSALWQQLFCLIYVFSTAKPESFAQVKL